MWPRGPGRDTKDTKGTTNHRGHGGHGGSNSQNTTFLCVPSVLRGKSSCNKLWLLTLQQDWRYVRERVVKGPEQENDYRKVHHELQRRVADDVPGLQTENAQQRHHPERIDQVCERLGGVVGLHTPTEVDVQR